MSSKRIDTIKKQIQNAEKQLDKKIALRNKYKDLANNATTEEKKEKAKLQMFNAKNARNKLVTRLRKRNQDLATAEVYRQKQMEQHQVKAYTREEMIEVIQNTIAFLKKYDLQIVQCKAISLLFNHRGSFTICNIHRSDNAEARYQDIWKMGIIDSETNLYDNGAKFVLTPFKQIEVRKTMKQIYREGAQNCLVKQCVQQIEFKINRPSIKQKTEMNLRTALNKLQEYIHIEGADPVKIQEISNVCLLKIEIYDIVGRLMETYNPEKKMVTTIKCTNSHANHVEGFENKQEVVESLDAVVDQLRQQKMSYLIERDRAGLLSNIVCNGTKYIDRQKTETASRIAEHTKDLKKYAVYLNTVQQDYLNQFLATNQTQIFGNILTLKQFKKLNHYDQTAAYTQHSRNKWYVGFPVGLSQWMKLDNQSPEFALTHYGMFIFQVISMPEQIETVLKFVSLDMKSLYEEEQEMSIGRGTSATIKMLLDLQVEIKLISGMFSNHKFDYEFPEELFTKVPGKKTIKGVEPKKIPLYSIFTGYCLTRQENTKFITYVTRDETIGHQVANGFLTHSNQEGDIMLLTAYENKEYTFKLHMPIRQYKKSMNHFGIYIAEYQKLNMIEQLLQLSNRQLDGIKRIAVDGIYTESIIKGSQLINGFVQKPNKTKNDSYSKCSARYTMYYNQIDYNLQVPEYAEFNTHIVVEGPGGSGKTQYFLSCQQLCGKILYVGHSNKLCASKHNEIKSNTINYEYPTHCLKYDYQQRIQTYNYVTIFNNKTYEPFLDKNNPDIIICDEISTQRGTTIKSLFELYPSTTFICIGDRHQTKPYGVDPTDPRNISSFATELYNQHILDKFQYSYRYKEETIRQVAEQIIVAMDKGYDDYEIYKEIKKWDGIPTEDINKKFNTETMIIIDNVKDKQQAIHNEFIKALPKTTYQYRIMNPMRIDDQQYYRGDIYKTNEPIKETSSIKECYAFTCHSMQGETIPEHITVYINPNQLFDSGILYTAISRCQKLSQIRFLPYIYTDKKPIGGTILDSE